jgi:hypothetical protein
MEYKVNIDKHLDGRMQMVVSNEATNTNSVLYWDGDCDESTAIDCCGGIISRHFNANKGLTSEKDTTEIDVSVESARKSQPRNSG